MKPAVRISMVAGAIILVVLILMIRSFVNKDKSSEGMADRHEVVVEEVIQGTTYTYLYVKEKKKEYWMAIARRPVEVGDELFFESALQMVDFTSKELDRTFDLIYFVQDIQGEMPQDPHSGMTAMPSTNPEVQLEAGETIDPPADGISLGALFASPKDYKDKEVKVRGKVIKVNLEIMGRNWVHVVDGTLPEGVNDLTLTTMDPVKEGDVVTFEGVVAIDKDFGAGYQYELIIENAVVISN